MAYNYSYNKQAAPDVLLGIITIDLGVAPLFLDYNLRTYDIVVYFENQLTNQQETDLNAIIANYVFVDTSNYATFNSVYTSEFSATTINSGSTNLYNIFSTIANSGETNTVSNIGSGFGLFKQKSGVDFQFRTLSAGTNISFITGDTITLNVTNDGNDITRVQPGANITTGGTENAPSVSLVASPSVNNITFSGSAIGGGVQAAAGTFTSLSATTLSGGTILSGGTNLYSIFSQTDTVTRVQPGSNITTGGTENAPSVSLVASPSVNNITFSGSAIGGSVQAAGVTATSLSATTLSGGTILSGGTNLYSIFSQTDTVTRVQPGANITTGGTANSPVVNVTSSPSFNALTLSGTGQFAGVTATSLSATTLSGGTILSGGTNLYNIFLTTAQLSGTSVSAGSNIGVVLTGNDYKVSTVASPSVNNITFSGSAIGGNVQAAAGTFTSLSATTLSGGTILSGGTNLYNIFLTTAQLSGTSVSAGSNIGVVLTGNDYKVSTVASPSFNALTLSGAGQFAGVTATSLSATTLSGGTILSGGTNLYSIFQKVGDVDGVANVNAGTNITTGGTATSPIISTVASPSFNALTLSGAGQFAGVTATSLSATTLSGGTILSGGTNLYSIFSQTDTVTRVQPGANITTGGTANAPSVSLVASPSVNNITFSGSAIGGSVQAAAGTFTSLSATTLSGGTILSGGTNLYSIFASAGAVGGSGSYNQAGSNITTGGTAANQTISIVDSPSLNGLTLSGNANIVGTLNVTGLTTVGALTATSTMSGTTLFLVNTGAIPNNPKSGATLFVWDRASRNMISQSGPSGIEYTFQPSLHGNKIAYWNPPGNATTVPGVFGMAALTATGTATARNVATTNLLTRTKRLALVSNAAAGSLTGYRAPTLQYTVGNGSGNGGFMYVIRFGVSDAQTSTRMFIGLRNTVGAPTNVEPSGLTNSIGVGNGAGNTNLYIFYGGSAAQTPINLGAGFPCNTNSQDLYELILFSPPNQNNVVGYQVTRLNSGTTVSGILTGTAGVALPSSTTLLAQNDFRTNNASGGAVGLDYVSIYMETDY